MGEHVLLVGMMGSGKSTVARLVATRIGRASVDTDEEVERTAGMSTADIFASEGEAGFRARESLALAEAAASRSPTVVSVGGGALLDPANRRLMRESGLVVWLRVSVDNLVERVGGGLGRPLLAGDPAAALERIEAERRSLYSETAEVVVDTDGLSAEEVADRVAAECRSPSAADSEPGGSRR